MYFMNKETVARDVLPIYERTAIDALPACLHVGDTVILILFARRILVVTIYSLNRLCHEFFDAHLFHQ